MASHTLSLYCWGQLEGVERQDTSELLFRACAEAFQANFKTNHLSVLSNKPAGSKLSQILQQEGSETSYHQKVQASMT